MVECEVVESVSTETVRRTLEKNTQALAERVLVCLRPAVRVCHGGRLEAQELCLDETKTGDSPPPAAQRMAYDYGSEQPVQLLPLEGWRRVEVTHPGATEYVNWWTFPHKERIVLVIGVPG